MCPALQLVSKPLSLLLFAVLSRLLLQIVQQAHLLSLSELLFLLLVEESRDSLSIRLDLSHLLRLRH
jgi:hypothetical protein